MYIERTNSTNTLMREMVAKGEPFPDEPRWIITGFIRAGCKAGTIPHVRVGSDYRINMRVWLEQLNAQSMTHISEGGN